MTDISLILGEVLDVDGAISIVPYSSVNYETIAFRVLWEGSDRYGFARSVRFGDNIWKPIGEKSGLSFPSENEALNYELKVLCLSLYSYGIAEGMEPLKWNTIIGGIRALRKFADSLRSLELCSLSDIKRLPDLKARNQILKAIASLGINDRPSLSVTLLTTSRWLQHYSVWNEREVAICGEYLNGIASHYVSTLRKRHPVIPTKVLKQLICSVEKSIDTIRTVLPEWEKIQVNEINKIKAGHYTIVSGRYHSVTSYGRYRSGLIDEVSSLPGLVNILVLAFTGMRDGEALNMRDDCVIKKKLDGSNKYFLKTRLSKTTDGLQVLEWICSEVTAIAVELLSSINSIIKEKARIILDVMSQEISDDYRNNLTFGLGEGLLFGVDYSFWSCRFFKLSKRPAKRTFNISKSFVIKVSEQDIVQLEKLDCNYKSISPNSGIRNVKYKPGESFNFTPHQFRHTFAWFIIANRLGDLDDIRYQYKHLWENMTLVYSQRGYESIGELLNIADEFSAELTRMAVGDLVESSISGEIAGKGGEKFAKRVKEILGENHTSALQPHFRDTSQMIEFLSNHSNNLRGLSHGYCTLAKDCKIKNVADPSHCVYCKGYIATVKHLPHWHVIKASCQKKLDAIHAAPEHMQHRLETFSMALQSNIEGANEVINKLTKAPIEKTS